MNPVQSFWHDVLGFCDCGEPESALEFMRDVLIAIRDRHAVAGSDNDAHTAAAEKINQLLPGMIGLTYLYVLTTYDLIEHGGSVYGSWLTDEGHEILEMLERADITKAMSEGQHIFDLPKETLQ